MDKPYITKLFESQGKDEAIIIIKGYSTDEHQPHDVAEDYGKRLLDAGWKGSIYHLWWDASNWTSIATKLSAGGVGAAGLAALASASVAAPITFGLLAGKSYSWSKIKKRAKKTGRDHALNLIKSNVTESKVSLLGHSLGARVCYYTLRTSVKSGFMFENVYLLGGAIRRDSNKRWGYVTRAVRGKLINVYNKHDLVLYGFKALERKQNPCGLKPIKEKNVKIINIDGSKFIWSSAIVTTYHSKYRKYLKESIAEYFHM